MRCRLLVPCLLLAAWQLPARGASFIPTESYLLENGMRVLLHQDRRYPVVMVRVCYQGGAGLERPGKSGLAHLAEHLLFEQTSGSYLSRLSASRVNATTQLDRTDDYMMVPAPNLEGALFVESGHMALVADRTFSPDLSTARRIVRNERRQRLETQPFGAAEERLWQALFPLPHPYHGFTIGSQADIEAVTLADLRDFFRRHYVPESAVLAVVGDFEAAAAKELVRKYFGSIPPGKDPSQRPPPPAPVVLRGEVLLRHHETVATHPRLVVAWHGPPALSAEDATASVLAQLLTSGRAGRLRRRLEEPGRAFFVRARQRGLRAQSVFEISIDAAAGTDLPGLLREVDAVLDEIRGGGVRAEEVRHARAGLSTGSVEALDSLPGKADLLQTYQLYRGQADWLMQDLLRHEAVTPEDVKRLVREQLRPDRRVVLFAEPGGGR